MPDIRLLLQSLMKKYSEDGSDAMQDEETLNQLVDAYEPNRYRLYSLPFPMGDINIPAFSGDLSFRMHGAETMCRYVRMLLRFGEFSGVGIKCSMGMGAIQWQEG